MRILVTNDDGVDATGLHVLARRLVELGDVVVAAPDREYSGAGAALGGLVEVPVMRLSSRLSNRLGLRPVFVTGCLVYAFGFLLWGLVEDPTLLSVLTVFEGAGFALLFTTMVVVIGRMLPSTLYSTGHSLAATMGFGIAPIIGAVVAGLLPDQR